MMESAGRAVYSHLQGTQANCTAFQGHPCGPSSVISVESEFKTGYCCLSMCLPSLTSDVYLCFIQGKPLQIQSLSYETLGPRTRSPFPQFFYDVQLIY